MFSSRVVVDLSGESPVCRPSTSSGSKFYDKRRYVAPLTLPDNFGRKLPKVRHQRKGANALDGVPHSRKNHSPNRPRNSSGNRKKRVQFSRIYEKKTGPYLGLILSCFPTSRRLRLTTEKKGSFFLVFGFGAEGRGPVWAYSRTFPPWGPEIGKSSLDF